MEAIYRSLLLVFMDNATAEYTFLSAFFNVAPSIIVTELKPSLTPRELLSPEGVPSELHSSTSDYNRQRSGSTGFSDLTIIPNSKEEQATYDSLWRQIFDPVLGYCRVNLLYLLFASTSLLSHFDDSTDIYTIGPRT